MGLENKYEKPNKNWGREEITDIESFELFNIKNMIILKLFNLNHRSRTVFFCVVLCHFMQSRSTWLRCFLWMNQQLVLNDWFIIWATSCNTCLQLLCYWPCFRCTCNLWCPCFFHSQGSINKLDDIKCTTYKLFFCNVFTKINFTLVSCV